MVGRRFLHVCVCLRWFPDLVAACVYLHIYHVCLQDNMYRGSVCRGRYKETQKWAGRNKQESTEGTRTGEKRQPTNAGQQHHASRKQHNIPTRATNGPPTRAPHMHQSRTPRTHHSTAHATKVAPMDSENAAPTAVSYTHLTLPTNREV